MKDTDLVRRHLEAASTKETEESGVEECHNEKVSERQSTPLMRLIKFLYRGEPDDPKMMHWLHPLVASVSNEVISITVLCMAERWILRHPILSPVDHTSCRGVSLDTCREEGLWRFGLAGVDQPQMRIRAAIGLIVYYLAILVLRVAKLGPQNIYESLWGCNVALLHGAVALMFNKPLWASAIVFTLAIDQILWYVDVISYGICRRFIVGVAAYLVWPETSFYKKVTCAHHLWFTPLLVYFLVKMQPSSIRSFPFLATISLGLVMETLLSIIPRFFLPKMALWPAETYEATDSSAPRNSKGQPLHLYYLNVNLSYTGWKDVKALPWLFAASWIDNAWWFQYLPYQVVVWGVINTLLVFPLFFLV